MKYNNEEKQEFFKDASNLIRSHIQNMSYPNDFLVYWNSKKQYFAQWLNLDNNTIRKRQRTLILEIVEKYQEITRQAQTYLKKWDNLEHEKETHETCKILKCLRDEEKIPSEIHEQDLEIISDCIVYCNHFFETGLLYLITNDHICYTTVKKITRFQDNKGKQICVPGFDSIKPQAFMDKIKAVSKSRKKSTTRK